VSSFIVGVAGALWGFVYLGSWEPAAFSIDRSFQLLFMVIIGGLGSIMGSFFGAAFIVILPLLLNSVPRLLGVTMSVTVATHLEFMIFGSLIVSLLMGGACATVVGVVFGIPSLRIKGLYLAVATLAAQFFVDWACLRLNWVTDGSSSGSVSVAGLNVFGIPIESPAAKYLLCLGFLIVFAVLAKNLVRGHVGREWMAIRDMDVAAAVIGIRPVYAKLSAFAVSSFIVGVAGALWGFIHLGSWEPAAFNLSRSFDLLFMVIIGGLGSIMGSFFGAAFIVVLPIVLDSLPYWFGIPIDTALAAHLTFMIFGGLIVFFLIVEPHGIARLWSTAKEKLRLWPFPH
jgi:branched-chain amino acid transport system permease protein